MAYITFYAFCLCTLCCYYINYVIYCDQQGISNINYVQLLNFSCFNFLYSKYIKKLLFLYGINMFIRKVKKHNK